MKKNIAVTIAITEEPTMGAKRNELRAELRENITNLIIRQKRPWTYVEFETSYGDEGSIFAWGVAKICWPDQVWDPKEGENTAIERALAWIVKEIIPPMAE
jgi:hypothetical protein